MKPRKPHPPREVRITVQGLRTGMYVSRLDIPWSESPYRLHGFKLADDAAIAKLKGVCKHVYIDTASGVAPEPRFLVFEDPELPHRDGPPDPYGDLRRHAWPPRHSQRAELADARAALAHLNGIDTRRLGLAAADYKAVLEPAIDSILRNPAALPWLHTLAQCVGDPASPATGRVIWGLVFGRSLGLDRTGLRHLALAALLCGLPGGSEFEPSAHVTLNAVKQARDLLAQRLEARLAEIRAIPGLPPQVLEMVAHHRAHHDGSGHPLGEAAATIPVFARLLGVVARFVALTHDAEAPRTPYRAGRVLYGERGQRWDAGAVDQFIQACGMYPVGSLVELSTGEIAIVAELDAEQRLRPQVWVLADAQGQALQPPRALELARVPEDANTGQPLMIRGDRSANALPIDWSLLQPA